MTFSLEQMQQLEELMERVFDRKFDEKFDEKFRILIEPRFDRMEKKLDTHETYLRIVVSEVAQIHNRLDASFQENYGP
jgi:hypothetical protein